MKADELIKMKKLFIYSVGPLEKEKKIAVEFCAPNGEVYEGSKKTSDDKWIVIPKVKPARVEIVFSEEFEEIKGYKLSYYIIDGKFVANENNTRLYFQVDKAIWRDKKSNHNGETIEEVAKQLYEKMLKNKIKTKEN